MEQRVMLVGEPRPCGSYLLVMDVAAPLAVRFGRFRGGEPVDLAAGRYVYVGSALGKRGSATLARRLVRHATRATGPPQGVRPALMQAFEVAAPAGKTLRWHVDYLLEETAVSLEQVVGWFTAVGVERAVARSLMADPHTHMPAPGLGASDDPGATHLLCVDAPASWWRALPDRFKP